MLQSHRTTHLNKSSLNEEIEEPARPKKGALNKGDYGNHCNVLRSLPFQFGGLRLELELDQTRRRRAGYRKRSESDT
jgi:hypothetical protein